MSQDPKAPKEPPKPPEKPTPPDIQYLGEDKRPSSLKGK